jgi:hypothetical protein
MTEKESKRLKKIVPTMGELRIIGLMRDYTEIRKRYYGSKIPPVNKVTLKYVPEDELKRLAKGEESYGMCLVGKFHKENLPYLIYLADDLYPTEERMTLLHEMAHLSVNIAHRRLMMHGKAWKNEMKRLARLGAFDNWW